MDSTAARINIKHFQLLTSWALMAFALPVWSLWCSVAAAAVGLALFWHASFSFPRPFWIAVWWFFAVQLVQIHWLASSEYMGLGIYAVYIGLALAIGVQFGWLTQLLHRSVSFLSILGASGFWIIMEWLRTLPLTGFTWNPIGLSLTATDYSMQFASIFGVYGLSFWVIFTNVLALRALQKKNSLGLWAVCACFPYCFGWMQLIYNEPDLVSQRPLYAALVQTDLKPEEKDYVEERSASYIIPLKQWENILSYFVNTKQSRFDLIVMPEGTVPWAINKMGYLYEDVLQVWISVFGSESVSALPPMQLPFARQSASGRWWVSNAFWAQGLANYYRSEIVIGLLSAERKQTYNSAYYFRPRSDFIARYDKQILVPLGEYVPLEKWQAFSGFVADRFGIGSSFQSGKEPKIFEGLFSLGISICSEEAYSDLIRRIRLLGAELFVNLSNDVWFPETTLPEQHYLHSKIRAAENGVCVLRACNKGVTGVIDCFGRELARLDKDSGVLVVQLPVATFSTPYVFWGDIPMLLFSFILTPLWLFVTFKKKKLL